MPGNPAIGAGGASGCINDKSQELSIVQRGFQRLIGPRCDIGAVEYSPYVLDLLLITS